MVRSSGEAQVRLFSRIVFTKVRSEEAKSGEGNVEMFERGQLHFC